MSVMLGNIQFNDVRDKLGFELTAEDRELWDQYNNHKADLSGMDDCFHVFDIPRCIVLKGEATKAVVLKIFDTSKLVEPKGRIQVYLQKEENDNG